MRSFVGVVLLLVVTACNGAGKGETAQAQSPTRAPTAPHAKDFPAEMNPLVDLLDRSDYSGAAEFLASHADVCLASKDCTYDAQVLYFNWTSQYENAGDWQGARKTLQSCVELLHDSLCTERLADLESQHRF